MGRDEDLLKKLIRRAAAKDLTVRDEAITMGIVEPDFLDVDWEDVYSKCRFIRKVNEGVINPGHDVFEGAPDDAIRQILDRSDKEHTLPTVIETLMGLAEERITKALAKPTEALANWSFVYCGRTAYPRLLLALMPVCAELTGDSWTFLEKKVEEVRSGAGGRADQVLRDNLVAAFNKVMAVKMEARAEKGRQTRAANRAAGIRRKDKFIGALESGDLDKVLRYKLKTFDWRRFNQAKDIWLRAPSKIKTAMMHCKPEFWKPYRVELIKAWLDKSAKGRRCYGLHIELTLNEWEQLEDDLRLAVLDKMFDGEADLTEWPSMQDTESLAVALKLMGEQHNDLSENLQKWIALRKIAMMAGKERDWARPMYDGYSAQEQDFKGKMGDVKGQMLFMACQHSEIPDLVPVLEVMSPAEQVAAAKLIMRFNIRKGGVGASFISKDKNVQDF
jgi:hypothetical protein